MSLVAMRELSLQTVMLFLRSRKEYSVEAKKQDNDELVWKD